MDLLNELSGDKVTLTAGPPRTADKPVPNAEVLFPEARRRRRRIRLGWVAAALCIALLLALVLFTVGHTTGRSTPAGTPEAARIVRASAPNEIVGWTSNFRLEVISTKRGVVERILASNVALDAPGLPTLSVSPGGEVFFDSGPIEAVSPQGAQGDQTGK